MAALPPLTGVDYDDLNARYLAAFEAGRFESALALAMEGTERYPVHFYFWMQASICALYLRRWQDAADYGVKALSFPGAGYSLYDSLAHAYGELKQPDKVRAFGLLALEQRDIMYGQRVAVPTWPIPVPPPAPAVDQLGRNWLALSLFGARSKYCETAVLNAELLPDIYPGWSAVVFVDDSVPAHVVERLHLANAHVHWVDQEVAAWPGPMWRLLAADLVGAQRVIFRDADSLISEREAAAVRAWVDSGLAFHIIRDSGSHTELLLAGLWGMVVGATPAMRGLVRDFLAQPVKNSHFADQWFLRQVIWPYARRSLMSHDSQYGFMDAQPLTVPPPHAHFHVGSPEGGALVTVRTGLPDGVDAHWRLHDGQGDRQRLVCQYPVKIQHGLALLELPFYYAQRIQSGQSRIEVEAQASNPVPSGVKAHAAQATAEPSDEARRNRFQALFESKDYVAALAYAQQCVDAAPNSGYFLTACTLCCTRLQRWQDALAWGRQAEAKADVGFNLFDALSYASWSLGQPDDVRRWGGRALQLRDVKFGAGDHPPLLRRSAQPPLPAADRVGRNVIAFSLFGADPKYVEVAVENAEVMSSVYPHWLARFYVDETVPAEAVSRLRQSDAEVVVVDDGVLAWPGAMWRLLAADDEGLDRVLFRDADALISKREAEAVNEWLADGAQFHMMRDAGTHTELLMAGLWGCTIGALPPLRPLIETYLKVKQPQGFARHYADQWFLRQCVWSYVRQDVLTHDSQFGFGRTNEFQVPLPGYPRAHVGGCVGGHVLKLAVPWADGVDVDWWLQNADHAHVKRTSVYRETVRQGTVSVRLTDQQRAAWGESGVEVHLAAMGQSLVRGKEKQHE